MNLKPVLLTAILAIGFTFQNCSSDDDGFNCSCPPILGEYFDIQGFELGNFKERDGCCRDIMSENEEVQFEDYIGLTIEYDVEYISTNYIEKKLWGFSLMNSALACSCIENGWEGSKEEKINSLTILTVNDFDQDHLANEPINDLLEVSNPLPTMDLNEFLVQDTTNIMYPFFNLVLKKAPELDNEFKVKVILELSTNENYELESAPIKIIN